MALTITEAPGGAGLQVLCPHCSRMHEAEEYPSRCKRCGTAMDSEAVKVSDLAEAVKDKA
jgi:predicted amidophosphoribosyltransferase